MKNIYFLLFLSVIVSSCNVSNEKMRDTVVIGGGLMGSSTAWHLSDQDQSVLLLEKQDSVYTHGSSYGEARIARSSNRGNDLWSYLHNRSLTETEILIEYLNSNEDEQHYSIEDIYTTSPVTYVGRISIFEKLMASLIRQNVDYKIASNPLEGKSIFDVTLPDSVLIQREYNHHSGTINPKILIQYLHQAIKKKDNEVRYNHQVMNIKKLPNHYELTVLNNQNGSSSVIKTKKVVSAAGPYSGTLLKNIAPYIDSLVDPQRVFLSFLKVKDEVYHKLTNAQKEILTNAYPVINSSTGTRDGSFFSLIEYYDNDNPIIKIGGHFQRSEIEDLDKVWQKVITDKEIAWSKSGMIRYMKLLNLPIKAEDLVVVDGYSCVYSLTDTEVPLVTPIPDKNGNPNNDFIILAGMSGVGAKGAMTYGLIGANLITNSGHDEEESYSEAVKALGFDRLMEDIK